MKVWNVRGVAIAIVKETITFSNWIWRAYPEGRECGKIRPHDE
jgi:hypothetical protein